MNLHSMNDNWFISCSHLGYEQLVDHLHHGLGVRTNPISCPIGHLEVSHFAHIWGLLERDSIIYTEEPAYVSQSSSEQVLML